MTAPDSNTAHGAQQKITIAAGDKVVTTITEGQALVLASDTVEVQGMTVDKAGELVIQLSDGASVTVRNFSEVAHGSGAASITLPSGQNVSLSELLHTLSPSAQDAGQTADATPTQQVLQSEHATTSAPTASPTASGAHVVVIDKPHAHENVVVKLAEGDQYQLGFNMTDPSSVKDVNGELVIAFKDGGEVIIPNYDAMKAAAAGMPPFIMADGTSLSVTDLADTLAQAAQLTNVEPAAGGNGGGGGAHGGGFGFGSVFTADEFHNLNPVGPINETELQYHIFDRQPQPFPLATHEGPQLTAPPADTVLEASLHTGPAAVTDVVTAKFFDGATGTFGAEGASSFTASGSLAGGHLTSGGQAVIVTESGDTYTGTAGGHTVFTLQVQTDGHYTFTLDGPLDDADKTNPHDIISLGFGVTAHDSLGASASTEVTVNVVDDAPLAHDDVNSFNHSVGVATGNVVTGLNGGPGAADYTSEDAPNLVTSISFGGTTVAVPTVGTATIDGTFGELKIADDGSYTYTLFKGPTGGDSFTYTLTDGDGDPSNANLTFNVHPDPIVTAPAADNVFEANLHGGPTSVSDAVTATFFGAGVTGTIAPEGASSFSASGSLANGHLTSGGQAVTVTESGDTYTGTAGGHTVFTMEVQTNGQYTFTLDAPLDDADKTNPHDAITLNFGVTATDSLADSSSTTISVNVVDDAPTAHDDVNSFNHSVGVATGNVVSGLNGGPGAADTLSADAPNLVTSVTFGGTTVAVPTTGTATIDGTFGTLKIADDGSYTYTLKSGPTGGDTFTYTLTDGDGDPSNANLTFNVHPDPILTAPPADTVFEADLHSGATSVSDAVTAQFFGAGVTGSIAATGASSFSASGSLENGHLTSGGAAVIVTETGNTYTGTANGHEVFSLALQPNGQYTFTLDAPLDDANPANPHDVISLSFGATATDSLGDSSSTSITVNVVDDAPLAHDDVNSFNQAIGHTSGNVVTGLNGGPGAADYTSADAPNLVTSVSFGGTTVAVPTTGTATIDGTFGELKIADDGSYTYTLFPAAAGGATVSTPHTFTGNSFPTDLSEGHAISAADQADLGELHSNMTINANTHVSGQITFDGAGYTNSLGAFTIAADGTLQAAQMLATSITGTGASFSVGSSAGAQELGFFLVANGFTTNAAYAGMDFSKGSLSFVYDYGQADQRTANVADNGSHVSLVFTEGGVSQVIQGPIYFTSDRGGTDSLNSDGVVHTISGVGSTSTNMTIGFEDLPNGGDKDYNDTVFNVQLTDQTPATGNDSFKYTLTDSDGDNSTANLSFNVHPTPTITPPVADTVLEAGLHGGPVSVSDSVATQFFGAGVTGTVAATGASSFSASGSLANGHLTSEGAAVTVTETGNTYTGTANGHTVFTMTLQPNGQYTFTLDAPLDDANKSDPADVIGLNFGVTATDTDGASASTTVTVNVVDDAPTAHDDVNAFNQSAGHTSGNVVTGLNGGAGAADTLSADAPNLVTSVSFGATTVAVPTTGTASITGTNGTLVIADDGTYTYTLKSGASGSDSFKYTLTDGDGDPSTANLSFNVHPNPILTAPAADSVYEASLHGGATAVTDAVTAQYFGTGVTGAVTATGASTFSASGSLENGHLTSGGAAVTVTETGNTYVGTANGHEVFSLSVASDGHYTFTLDGPLDDANPANPHDVITLNFGLTATDSAGSTAATSVAINVVDDAPVAHDDVNTFNQSVGHTSGNVVTGLNGGPGAADYTSADAPNLVTQVSFGSHVVNVPTTGTATIDGTFGELKIADDGSYTYTLFPGGPVGGSTVSTPHTFTGNSFPTDLSEGQAIGAADQADLGELHSNMTINANTQVSGQITFDGAGYTNSLGAFTIAADGTLQAAQMLATSITGTGTSFSVGSSAGAQELGFFLVANGFNTNASYAGMDFSKGTLSFVYDYGQADQRTANVADNGSHVSLVFTEGGVSQVIQGPIYFTSDRGGTDSLNSDGVVHTLSGVGSTSNNMTIAFEDLPNGGDKDYNDTIFNVQLTDQTPVTGSDNFKYTLTDSDGDPSTANLSFNVHPAPTITAPLADTVLEAGLHGGPVSVTDTVTAQYSGTGVTGSITATGASSFSATGSVAGGHLTSEGAAVTVTETGNTYTGTANGHTVFTMTLQPNGQYTFTLDAPLDDADKTNPHDAINLNFGVTATDTDGSSASTSVTVSVVDDAPAAHDDVNAFNQSAGHASGNVVTGLNGGAGAADTLSVDAPNLVTSVSFGATTVAVPTTGTASITGTNGTLVIADDGTYTYTLKSGATGSDSFKYTLTDGDGDPSTANLSFNVHPNPILTAPAADSVYEANLHGGNTSVSDAVTAQYFGTGVTGSVAATGASSFSASGSLENGHLTSGGAAVTVTETGNTYVGTANGHEVFSLAVQSNGAYTFTLDGPLDDANPANPHDVIGLNFGVTATDSAGSTASTSIAINVVDDAPIAHDDVNTFSLATGHTSGNVVTGLNGGAGAADYTSADAPNLVTSVSFGGTTVAVPTTGTATIDGTFGELKIDDSGTYTYTLFAAGVGPTVSTAHVFTGNSFPTDLSEGHAISAADRADLGEVHTNMTIDANTQVSGQITFDGAGYTNSLGAFTIAADGTLEAAQMVATSITGTGASFNIASSTGAQELGFFLVANGYNTNAAYAGLDFAHGTLSFVYDYGQADQRAANVADNGSNVSLVLTDGTGAHVIDGPIYFTTDRSGSDSLNADGVVHTISGVGSNANTLTIGFEDLPNGGDNDYNDTIFNVQLTDQTPVAGTDAFKYTLTDSDGDASIANLTFNGVGPSLLVGSNGDDTGTSTTPYVVGTGHGTLTGTLGGDIIVGDAGGSALENVAKNYNVELILDVSGSMGSVTDHSSKYYMLVQAVDNLLNDLHNYKGGSVTVDITPFDTTAHTGGSFTITSGTGYTDALNFLEHMGGGGTTNYESAMQAALGWYHSSAPTAGATDMTYFVTDGEPNTYVSATSGAASGSEQQAMNEILGISDGTNEVGQLQALGTVTGVGINVGSSISNIDLIDSSGHAVNVVNPADLSTVLQAASPLNQLASVGNDTIHGGNGGDIIFGDSVNTDALAVAQGLHTIAGDGWDVFTQLEAGHGTDASWSRADTISYIETHLTQLAAESTSSTGAGRTGGDDTITGGTGDDIIFGQEGNDVIDGGAGNNTIYGGSGANTFVISTVHGNDTIMDFNAAQGDKIDLHDVLAGFDPLTSALHNFVSTTTSGANTIVSVDPTGSGHAFQQVAVLEGVHIDVDTLAAHGNLVA